MAGRLADGVRVRQEAWGLLFYSPSRHRLCFVRSGDWLHPGHFDGTWTRSETIDDIAGRTGLPAEAVERCLPRLTARLLAKEMIVDEVR